MKPSQRIVSRAKELSKLRLGSEYGYMGRENSDDFINAIVEYLDEVEKQ